MNLFNNNYLPKDFILVFMFSFLESGGRGQLPSPWSSIKHKIHRGPLQGEEFFLPIIRATVQPSTLLSLGAVREQLPAAEAHPQ